MNLVELKNAAKAAGDSSSKDDWTTTLYDGDKERSYRVVDGDTIQEILENGRGGERIRVSSYDAAETSKPIYDDNGNIVSYKFGDKRGDYDKKTLKTLLDNGHFSVENRTTQSYGGGAGGRTVANLLNRDTGENLSQSLLSSGYSAPSEHSSEQDIDAYYAGIISRDLFGEPENDPIAELRDDRPALSGAVRALAPTKDAFRAGDIYHTDKDADGNKRTWFETSFADQIFSGASVEKWNTDAKGYATNPISTAWSTGWRNVRSDFGAATSWIGYSLGLESLEEYGDTVAKVQSAYADQAAPLQIQRFKDIAAKSDNALEGTANAISWLATTSTSSIPYMAAILSGTAAAGVLGVTGIAGAAIATAPSSVLFAGTIWNGVPEYATDENGDLMLDDDGEFVSNRTPTAAGAALVGGIAAATLERFALGRLLKPSALTGKGGLNKAAEIYTKVHGGTLAGAKTVLEKQFGTEARLALKHVSDQAAIHGVKVSKAQRGLAVATDYLSAAGTEGLTEVGQELTTFLTSQALTERPSGPDEVLALIGQKFDLNDEDIQNLIIESAAGGVGVGTVFKGAKSAYDASQGLRERAWNAESNPLRDLGAYRATAIAMREQIGKSVTQVTGDLTKRTNSSTEAYDPEYFEVLQKAGKESGAIKRIVEGKSGVLKELTAGLGSLILTPLKNHIGTAKIKAAPSLFKLISIVGGSRDALAGQAAEDRVSYLSGSLEGVFGGKTIGTLLDFDHESEKAQELASQRLYHFRDALKSAKGNKVSGLTNDQLADLAAQGLIPKGLSRPQAIQALGKWRTAYFHAQQHGNQLFKMSNKARKAGLAHRGEKAEIGFKEDWVFTHREFSPEVVVKDPTAFKAAVITRLATLKQLGRSKKQLSKIHKNPIGYADALYNNIVYGTVIPSQFNVVGGKGTVSGEDTNRTVLFTADENLAQKDGADFNKFFYNNIFSTQKRAREKQVRELVNLEYYGDGGRNLSLLFSDIKKELEANTDMSADEIQTYLEQLAGTVKDVINSSQGNYNTFAEDHPTLAALQENVLAYTTVLGLPLAAITSIAENGAIAVGLRGSAEFKKAVGITAKQFAQSLNRSIDQTAKTVKNKVLSEEQGARLENTFFDLQMVAGIPQDQQGIARRVGILDENNRIPSNFRDKALDAFFKVTLLSGLTSVQRTIATSTGLTYIQARAEQLLPIKDKLNDSLTSSQLDAKAGLSQLGIDVKPFLDALQKEMDRGEGSSATLTALSEGRVSGLDKRTVLEEQILIGIQSFVDTRIQNPKAYNRPLLVQDPRFKLLSQFNGFLSTVTTQLVPKIWNDEIGRGLRTRNPGLTYDVFTVVVAMLLLGAASQYMKDWLKFGESSPYVNDPSRVFQRYLGASGILGQGEKLVDIIHPLYPQRDEGIATRAAGTFLGVAGRQGGQLVDLADVPDGDVGSAQQVNKYLKLIPFFNTFTNRRKEVAEYISS